MFGLDWPEVLALVVIALLVFGPDKLPQAAAQAGRALRRLRRMAQDAKADLQANLGPEFRDFDPAVLNPKTFVRKHLIDDLEKDWYASSATPTAASPAWSPAGVVDELEPGEIPPYDHEAT